MGEISCCVLELSMRQEITARDVATTLQLSRRHASLTVYDLARHGHLTEVARRPVEGGRPVPVYRAAAPAPASLEDQPFLLLLDWPRGT